MMQIGQEQSSPEEVIGLLPAGGRATRIAPLPCSKELFPIGFRPGDADTGVRPKVICHYLLEKMQRAGINKVYIVVREGKWDIPAYLLDGGMIRLHIAYLIVGQTPGAPYTLDQAYPFVRNARVTFGFPDILFQGEDAFGQLLTHQVKSAADVVLGLFPADQPQKVDMVDLDDNKRVRQIVIRPRRTALRYTWGIAVWTPIFTQFLHEYVANRQATNFRQEFSVGDVIQAAIGNGLRVEAKPVSDAPYLDIGTPEDLVRAVKRFAIE